MTKLSVNVNKLATLRNSRGKNTPDVLKTTLKIIEFGAQGITVHPRPDERHIRRSDVFEIARSITVEFNIEGYPSEDFLELIEQVKPAQATLVPDDPNVITSNAGWDIQNNTEFLQKVIKRIQKSGVRTSLFIDPNDFLKNEKALNALVSTKTDRIELYTEEYADAYATNRQDEVTKKYQLVSQDLYERNIGINAGHDLNLQNLRHLVNSIPQIAEVSIGHALISDALDLGLKETIKKYRECLS